jgi:hypothetical protein
MALAAYVLPMAVGVASRVSHDAQHVLELIRELESRAAAMGVAHLHDQVRFASVSIRGVESAPDDGFVHTHGGAPHAHDDGVGKLLVASEQAEEHHQDVVTAPVELSIHVPATASLRLLQVASRSDASADPDAAAHAPPSSPRLSPSRR